MTATFESLCAIDEALAAAGHHALTPFWRETFERLYSGAARSLIARVGRGGAKSFSSVKFALNETLAGDWIVPPGERHWFAFVSRLKEEVSQRRILLESFLRSLGVPFESKGDVVELVDKPLGFRFFAASVAATSGFRCIGYVADELAKWESDDGYRNPAGEVISSLSAMCITHSDARSALISSPWSLDDYHAERFARGDTSDQRVASAPSWIANPGITEAQTHEAEPDPKKWAREYGAEPGATESTAFEPADVAAAFTMQPTGKLRRNYTGALVDSFVLTDASSLRGDAFTWAVGVVTDTGEIIIRDVQAFEEDDLKHLSMGYVVDRIAADAKKVQARRVYGDQREEASLRTLFAQKRLEFCPFAWSESSKDTAVQLVRRAMAERKIALPEHAKLRKQLLGLRARLLPSGKISYPSNGLDYASLLITLGHALAARKIDSAVTPHDAFTAALRNAAQNPARFAARRHALAEAMIFRPGAGRSHSPSSYCETHDSFLCGCQ